MRNLINILRYPGGENEIAEGAAETTTAQESTETQAAENAEESTESTEATDAE